MTCSTCSVKKMSQMVYCKLKEKKTDSAIYNIGTDVNDMSGEVVFFKDLREPELLKQAKENPVRVVHLARIYGKYRNAFASGKFKEKLSYEIG